MGSPVRHYVGGGFHASDAPFPLVDAVTGRAVGEVPEAPRTVVDRAVPTAPMALRHTFDTRDLLVETGRRPVGERQEPLMHRALDPTWDRDAGPTPSYDDGDTPC